MTRPDTTAAALPLPMRIPMRLLERISALGSGVAFAALVAYLNSLDFAFGHNSSGPWTLGLLLVFGITSAFVLRRQAGKRWLVAPALLFSVAGYVSALEESYQKPWSTAPDHISTGEWLAMALGGFTDARFLLAALAMFVLMALPLHLARRRTERGIAGQEQGEAFVAFVSLAVAFPVLAPPLIAATVGVGGYPNGALRILMAAAAGAALVNVVALGLALLRSVGRARFLRRVAEGHEPAFRIDDTPQGRALVRVTKQGEGYRVADFTETLLALSEIEPENDPVETDRPPRAAEHQATWRGRGRSRTGEPRP